MKNKEHQPEDQSTGLRIVAIGGGNGLSTLLSGLKLFVAAKETEPVWVRNLSAVVAVTDDGGSSGRLRDELKMLPPGDIRNCLVALSEDSYLLSRLFRHRFGGQGELGGHSFGNLFLAALAEVTGDFSEAVRISSEILATKGHIFPATPDDVTLTATLGDGTIVSGETRIGKVGDMIVDLTLEPDSCEPLPEAVDAIRQADIITVGPGSLFTSLLPPLLVREIAALISESDACKVLICNLMTQPGETEGFSSLKHLETIRRFIPPVAFDHILVNDEPIRNRQETKYAGRGSQQIGPAHSISPETIENVKIFYGNLLDDGEKVRHHPEKLARAVLRCVAV